MKIWEKKQRCHMYDSDKETKPSVSSFSKLYVIQVLLCIYEQNK